jgi:hypothetical protein
MTMTDTPTAAGVMQTVTTAFTRNGYSTAVAWFRNQPPDVKASSGG